MFAAWHEAGGGGVRGRGVWRDRMAGSNRAEDGEGRRGVGGRGRGWGWGRGRGFSLSGA